MEDVKLEKTDIIFDHTWIGDLIYYDGPLESIFRDKEGKLYLYSWCDCNEIFNRWIVIHVDYKLLKEYILGKISLKKYYN